MCKTLTTEIEATVDEVWNFIGRMPFYEYLKLIHITESEHNLISGKQYLLKDNGTVKVVKKIYPLLPRVKLLINILMRNKEGEINLEITHAEWANIIELINIRNRITHPNSSTDINISDQELQIIFNAAKYIQEAIIRALIETVLRNSMWLAKAAETDSKTIEKIILENFGHYIRDKKK